MPPFFSICIPQYNRTDFLMAALESMRAQTFQDFEVCISDGGSTDGGTPKLEAYLATSGLSYVFERAPENLQYDPNLRKSIGLSSGRYVWLMGNDDALADPKILQRIHDDLIEHQPVAVAISNYRDLPSGEIYRRMRRTGVIDGGAMTAALSFRHYAFVGGIIFEGAAARGAPTEAVDGGEMYQMYLGSKLLGDGGRFLEIDRIAVDKDIQLPDQKVDSYRDRQKTPGWPLKERPLPMGRILATVSHGLERSKATRLECRRAVSKAARQLYLYTYPYWIFEYRRVQSYGYALGVYLALRPSRTMDRIDVGLWDRVSAWAIWSGVGLAGFLTPVALFERARPFLYRLAKRSSRTLAASTSGSASRSVDS